MSTAIGCSVPNGHENIHQVTLYGLSRLYLGIYNMYVNKHTFIHAIIIKGETMNLESRVVDRKV